MDWLYRARLEFSMMRPSAFAVIKGVTDGAPARPPLFSAMELAYLSGDLW
jgi:hypothetical protein